MQTRSPLAPTQPVVLHPLPGVRLGAVGCAIRYRDRPDLALIELAPGTTMAAALTRSRTAAAPVLWCRDLQKHGRGRAIVVNSGNANAYTGAIGRRVVEQTAEETSRLLGCAPNEVWIASTGVIGAPPPAEKIIAGLQQLAGHTSDAPEAWTAASAAILTTDTFAKLATRVARIDGVPVRLQGFAKGSGMIAPDMATMLAFVFTDAMIPAAFLQAMLSPAVHRSFNSITVDSDTSTSDTLLFAATGGGTTHRPVTSATDRHLDDFREQLQALLIDLAQQVVRDGEGATKFVTIRVAGAQREEDAHAVALSIANSPLVKTALAGEDANWGRIIAAIGKAPAQVDCDRIVLRIGGHLVASLGGAIPGYDETPIAAHMKGQEILVEVDLGLGNAAATVWTCDLTHEYIRINADYRS